eukprot:1183847-Prorocentrum_minimum.AAC.1
MPTLQKGHDEILRAALYLFQQPARTRSQQKATACGQQSATATRMLLASTKTKRFTYTLGFYTVNSRQHHRPNNKPPRHIVTLKLRACSPERAAMAASLGPAPAGAAIHIHTMLLSVKPRSRLSASDVAVCRQGIYVEYLVEYSSCRALNGILVSTVDDCRLLS